jgi:hypothetical protein
LQTAENETILAPLPSRGDLMTDRRYLESVANFLTHQGQPIVETSGFAAPFDTVRIFTKISEIFPEAREIYRHAFTLIKQATEWHQIFDPLVDLIVPLDRPKITGLSTHYARGAVFIAFFPEVRCEEIAIGMILE